MSDDESSTPLLKDHLSSYQVSVSVPRTAASYHLQNPENEEHLRSDTCVALVTPAATVTHVYSRRWYILFVYSLLTFTQDLIWNTFSPISEPSKSVYGWSVADIAFLTNWGPIGYIIAAVPFAWLTEIKGLRPACLLAMGFTALGTVLRCITYKQPAASWLIHTGQFLNGLCAPVAGALPPVLSSTWFPVHERATATAISSGISILGIAVSFIIGPFMVPSIHAGNGTAPVIENVTARARIDEKGPDKGYTIYSEASLEQQREDMMRLLYVECGWSILVFLLMLVYFPSKPPKPPTISASIERMDIKTGILKLIRCSQFWLIGLAYGISLGVYYCWQGILDVDLSPHGISQNETGWLGFYSIVGGGIAGILVSRFSDLFSKHLKAILLVMYTISTVSFGLFTLSLFGIIPTKAVALYPTIIIGGIFLNGATPPLYEMAVEATYPIGEIITMYFINFINNIGGLIFLGVQMIPGIGTDWENWCLIAAVGICIPLLLCVKEHYRRTTVDEILGKAEGELHESYEHHHRERRPSESELYLSQEVVPTIHRKTSF
ncbi:hypothetical protein CHS0354_017030 [Potamilus streckersoni]|uniref:Uncharacterized protein n=1 Tax=Potamilus streckersoni TaxID=2493646 RepID=A0AAE0SZ26_9BIVA|nr:hypothetical protein CHS0354_017030 [Potamilus streckersoni]